MSGSELAAYGLLCLAAFGAASLLPLASEPLLVAMLLLDRYETFWLWFSASVGNTAGATVNWWLARYALRWQQRRWFPVNAAQLQRATRWFQRYGRWTLLLAWVPGGDALTVIAGLLRVPLGIFLLLVGIGKAGRYAVLIWLTP